MVLDFAKEAIDNSETHSINFDELKAGKANIKVIGVGGMGNNTVTWLFNKGISGATVYAANTDALHLSVTKADEKLLIGKELTKGLGCGGLPKKGREAAKEALVDLKKSTSSSDMVFVIAGMGGGTGTGAAPIVAGMVVSGAFFGDKMSPISDTTNLSALSAGADLYDHIKAMMYTTVPSYIIALIIYTFVGFKYASGTGDPADILLIQSTLEANFNLNPIVILPMVVLFGLNLKKVDAIPAMIIGAFTGILVAMIFQGASLSSALTSVNYGYGTETGVALVDNLLLRGGIQRMMWTFSLSFIALCLGGVLETVGYLRSLIAGIVSRVKSVGLLVTTVIGTTILGNAAMGEIYLGIILNGSLYKEEFKERGLKPSMLSRLLEEGGTLTGALIPWTTAGAFMATTLGVSTLEYLPYAFLNLINPVLSIVLSFMGIFILWENKEMKGLKKKKTDAV